MAGSDESSFAAERRRGHPRIPGRVPGPSSARTGAGCRPGRSGWRRTPAAATTAATATIVPASALRTGTAVRPRPGSNAIRTPMLPGTDPASPSADPSRDGRAGRPARPPPSGPRARPAARHAAGTSTASGSTAMTARPTPSTARLTSTPGAGSASRAGPIGISGEAAMATATAMHRPGDGHRGQPGQGQRGQAGPGHAQRAQDRELRRIQDQLAGQQLADHGQPDQPGQHGEHRQRHRLRADRPLRGRHLIRQADDIELPAGGRVPFRQRAGGAAGTRSCSRPAAGAPRPRLRS